MRLRVFGVSSRGVAEYRMVLNEFDNIVFLFYMFKVPLIV